MRALLATLHDAFLRQREIENLSPAARAMEQRSLDQIGRSAFNVLHCSPVPHGHDLDVYRVHVRSVIGAAGELPLDAGQLKAVATDAQEAHLLLVRCQTFLAQALAAQGDTPDRSLLQLQHDIAGKLDPLAVPF